MAITFAGPAVKAISAGTALATAATLLFSNANGVSFGADGATITGSVAPAGITNVNLSAGTTSNNLSAFVFSNSNGVTFGLDGSTVTASVAPGGGGITNINVSAGTTSNLLSALTFSNANNVSFGLNSSTVTASASFPAQTNQTAGLYALGNTTGESSSTTRDARSLSFSGLGIVSVGFSDSRVLVSATQSAQTQNVVVPSAGTQTATSGTVVFSNSNGISFGMSGSTRVTASYTVPSTAGLLSNINVSAGTTSGNLSAVTFSNSNGVSFGLNASTVTGSVAAGATATGNFGALAAGTQTATSGTVVLSDSNGISFGMSGSTRITASYTVPTQTNQTVGLYALGNTTQNSSTTLDARTLSFNALGAATMGYSNGSIQVSVPTQTAQTQSNIQAVYDGANSISTGTIRFTNANGVSFSINGQTLSASIAAPVAQTNQTVGLYALGNTTQNSSTTLDARTLSFNALGAATMGYSNGSIQVSVPTQTNQQVTLFATGNTTQSSTGTSNASSLIFRGQGVASVGITNGSIVIDAPAGAPSPVNFSAGTTSGNLGSVVFSNSNGVSFGLNAATITASVATSLTNVNLSAGTTSNNLSAFVFSNSNGVSFGLDGSTVTGSVATSLTNVNLSAGTTSNNLSAFVFSDSNGVSFGLNGSTVTASVNAGGDKTLSYYDNLIPGSTSTSQVGDGTMRVFPLSPANEFLPGVITANTIQLNVTGTVSTGAAFTRSVSIGFYTINNSTQLSLAFSASTSWGTNAGNMNINDSMGGWRWITFHSSQFNNAPQFSASRYFCAIWNRSSGGSQSFSSFGMASMGLSNVRSGTMGAGSSTNTTLGWYPFNGIYSASFTTAMPGALAASDIRKNVAEVAWIPQVVLNSLGTVV